MGSHSSDSHESVSPISRAPEIEQLEIIELLGSGGMAQVYKARQILLDRIVAVKVLAAKKFDKESSILRFQQEAKLSASLDHPNIAKTLGHGTAKDGTPYLIMEYLEGQTLSEELRKTAPIRFRRFQQIFIPLLSALEYAHNLGLVHRDIKPGNIMILRAEDGMERVKLLDFGLALMNEIDAPEPQQRLTQTGLIVGSPAYMSPEQCQGKPLDRRADLYSLACVMYQSLCCDTPFSGDSPLALMHQHMTSRLPSTNELSRRMELPPQLAKVILAGLAKNAGSRHSTAAEFAQKLNKVLAEITLDRAPQIKNTGSKGSQRLIWIGLIAMSMIAGAAISQFMSISQNRNTSGELRKYSKFTPSQLLEKGDELFQKQNFREAVARYESAIKEFESERRKPADPIWYAKSAGAAVTVNESQPQELKRFLEIALKRATQAYIPALKINGNKQVFLELSEAKLTALEKLGRKEEMLAFTQKLLSEAASFNEIDRLKLQESVMRDEFLALRTAEAKAILEKNGASASSPNPEIEAAKLRLKLILAKLYAQEGRKKEALALGRAVSHNLINRRDIRPSRRCDILSTLGSLDNGEFLKTAIADLKINSPLYEHDQASLIRLEQSIAFQSKDVEQAISHLEIAWQHAQEPDISPTCRRDLAESLISMYSSRHNLKMVEYYSNELFKLKL